MKTKRLITGLFLISALILTAGYATAQDEEKGTFIEESGEKQDSTKQVDIFDFSLEVDEEKSSSAGLIIGIAAVVLVGGGVIYLVRRKKKAQAG